MEFYYDETDKEVLVISVDGGLLADTSDRFRGEIEGYIDLGRAVHLFGRRGFRVADYRSLDDSAPVIVSAGNGSIDSNPREA